MNSGSRMCPEPEALTAYFQGELPAEERVHIKAHVDSCGMCDMILERLKIFDGPRRIDLPAPEWPSIVPALKTDFRKRLGALNPPVRETTIRWFHPLMAWSFVLLLAYPAWLGLHPPKPFAAPALPVTTPDRPLPAVVLPVLKVQDTRGPNATQADLGDSSEFALTFFVPAREGSRFDLEIQDAHAAVIVRFTNTTSSDRRGNFTVVCRRSSFPKGSYRVMLQSENGNRIVLPFRIL